MAEAMHMDATTIMVEGNHLEETTRMVQIIHQREATIIDIDHATYGPSHLVIMVLQMWNLSIDQLRSPSGFYLLLKSCHKV